MSRELLIREMGDPPRLALADAGPHPPGEARLTLLAAEVQPLDRQVAAGRLPGAAPVPLRPGTSAVARVVQAAGFEPGDVVVVAGGRYGLGTTRPGTFAEEFSAPAECLVRVPADLDPRVVAAGAGSAFAARLALEDHAAVRRGDVVAVLGASGGVGSAAVALAAHLGATVVAVSRSAQPVVDGVTAATFEDAEAAIREVSDGRGADVIIDTVGGERLVQAIRYGGPRCRHVCVGYSAGMAASLVVPLLMVDEHQLLGFNAHAAPPDRAAAVMGRVLDDLRDGIVPVAVGAVFGLAEAGAAYARVGGRGRVLLVPGR